MLATYSAKARAVIDNMGNALVGQTGPSRLAVIAMLAGGHILMEDVPGVGKTLLAKSLATSIKSHYKRIQSTPDLLPSDVSGVNIFEQKENAFKFVPGPIFTNILLVDEINRATPRTQSSLLEAMAEGQVTTDGVTRTLPELFYVIATQNPIEQHGTFPLPEAQLDRFMIAMSLGYPDAQAEREVFKKSLTDGAFVVEPVMTLEEVLQCRQVLKQVFAHDVLIGYIVDIVHATRRHPAITLGVSPRGGQLLLRAAQANAFLEGREYVTPEDIKFLAPYVLGHRIVAKVKAKRVSHAEIIHKVLESVAVPT